MIGAIIGDMAGCRFENHPHQPGLDPLDFPLFAERTSFTDDTVLSFAVCEALMESSGDPERMQEACCRRFKEFARKYPRAGYGRRFWEWACSREARPFASFGNGSAMRVSPVGWSFETLEETECMARASALPSRSHPEGIKGACSVAAAIFLARKGKRAEEIRDHIQRAYGYDMERHLRDMAIRASTPHARARFRRPLSAPLRRQAPKKPSGPPYSCATMRTRRAPLPDP